MWLLLRPAFRGQSSEASGAPRPLSRGGEGISEPPEKKDDERPYSPTFSFPSSNPTGGYLHGGQGWFRFLQLCLLLPFDIIMSSVPVE